jgi:hypothetical protein
MTEERKHAIFRAGVSTSSHLSGKPTNRDLACAHPFGDDKRIVGLIETRYPVICPVIPARREYNPAKGRASVPTGG